MATLLCSLAERWGSIFISLGSATCLGPRLLQMPIEIWPGIGTALAASRADEPLFDIGQPNVIRPLMAAGLGQCEQW